MIWLYGASGSGKTTLARRLTGPRTILLDGDELRQCWSLGFSREARFEQGMRAARLAMLLERQGFEVIVAVIAPYRELRTAITELCHPHWVLVEGGDPPSPERPFER